MSKEWVERRVVVTSTYVMNLPEEDETARFLIEECDYLALNHMPPTSIEILEMERTDD